jgi:hypothetical protein
MKKYKLFYGLIPVPEGIKYSEHGREKQQNLFF